MSVFKVSFFMLSISPELLAALYEPITGKKVKFLPALVNSKVSFSNIVLISGFLLNSISSFIDLKRLFCSFKTKFMASKSFLKSV